ncbi:SPFH domain-containing protein [Providencia rustigianii]|uniref:SPFH domain-containing protein n=1 Tax=Providencia rustigianii TaxID=158850 RepID=UPI00223F80EF|nr:SPFH domain-containing protein [Providencia rustigianii]
MVGVIGLVIFLLFLAVTLYQCVRIVPQADQWVVERLGKYHTTLNPGLNILIPFLDNVAYRMSAKDQMIEVKGIEAITKDNAMTKVNAICFIRVADPKKAVYGVDNFNTAVRNLVMTTIRNAVGGMELDETLTNRDQLAAKLRSNMDVQMEDWGLMLRTVDIQDITPSDSMLKSMEKQAAAVRERKATEELAAGNKNAAIMEAEGKKESLILDAEAKQESAIREATALETLANGQFKASSKLAEALTIEGGREAMSFQLANNYIQTLSNLATSPNAKVVAMPADLAQSVGGLINAGSLMSVGSAVSK